MKKTMLYGLYIIGITLLLGYLFWPNDIIPEMIMPFIGYIDDAIVALLIFLFIRKATVFFKLDKGGKKK